MDNGKKGTFEKRITEYSSARLSREKLNTVPGLLNATMQDEKKRHAPPCPRYFSVWCHDSSHEGQEETTRCDLTSKDMLTTLGSYVLGTEALVTVQIVS